VLFVSPDKKVRDFSLLHYVQTGSALLEYLHWGSVRILKLTTQVKIP
jgi:hypothetical protein